MKKPIGYILIILPLTFLVFSGCDKDNSNAFTDWPIIESYLEPGNYLMVTVTRQVPFSAGVDYSPDDINHLSVQVICNNTIHQLTPADSGRYIDSSFIVSEGDAFDLSFTYNSKNVSAYTYIPSKPEGMTQSATKIYVPRMDSTSGPPTGTTSSPVEITWENDDESYYLLVVENIESTLDPIRDFGDDEPPANRFRKSPTNSAFESIRPFDFQYYGTHRIILFHVLPDYAALYDQNSTSSLNLTNPSSSIANGYGIFTGLSSDTLYLEVKESSK